MILFGFLLVLHRSPTISAIVSPNSFCRSVGSIVFIAYENKVTPRLRILGTLLLGVLHRIGWLEIPAPSAGEQQ